jgi:hypothetical protein
MDIMQIELKETKRWFKVFCLNNIKPLVVLQISKNKKKYLKNKTG